MKSFSSRPTSGRGVARRLFACEDGRRLCAPVAAARPRDRHTRASLGVVDLEARPGAAAGGNCSMRSIPTACRRRVAALMVQIPRLGMSLSALLVSAFLVIVGAPSSFADPSPDPDLAQSVAAHEEWSISKPGQALPPGGIAA